jgi:hypothetical protein
VVTLVALVLTIETKVAWAGATIAMLIGAALLLIVCTQFALAARVQFVSPVEERAWFGNEHTLGHADRLVETKRWCDLAAAAYNSGLVLLLDAVAVFVVPATRTR